MPSSCRPLWIASLVLFAAGAGRAQEKDTSLAQAVEAYFDTVDEKVADLALDTLLAREDATPTALLAAVQSPPKFRPGETTFTVPHLGQGLVATLRIPKGHSPAKPPLPVVCDVSRGSTSLFTKLDPVITTFIPGYTPPQFSDEGRDAFLKVARTAAFRAHGDRLWLTGYSWAAHASYDTALHRPGFLRGIAPTGGGPRRVHFRLLANLGTTTVLAFCGEQDDPELVWNLRELDRRRKELRLDYHLALDPTQGHNAPVAGYDKVPARILAAAATPRPEQGTLLADGPGVENPRLRCLDIEDRKVRVPSRIPVSPRMSADEQRRATIKAMRSAVASVAWKVTREKDTVRISVRPKSVRRLHVFVRASDQDREVESIEVRRGSKRVFRGPLAVDRRVLLTEARRTRERLDPAIQAIPVGR